jgi:MutS domain V
MLPSEKKPPSHAIVDPGKEYAHRLKARRQQEGHQAQRYTTLARARNVFFILIVLVAWLCEKERLLPLLLVLPVVLFITFLIQRNRSGKAWRRAWRAAEFYERRLACVEERWSGGHASGLRFRNESHPYAADLDLFGTGCLFELLCTACTRTGEDTLAAWLLSPASAEEVRQRQAAVAELRPRLDLREELALLGPEIPAGNHLEALAEWGKTALLTRGVCLAAVVLMTLAMAAFVGWMLGAGPVPFLLVLLLEGLFALALRKRVRRVLDPLERREAVLRPFASLLERLECQTWTSPRLEQLRTTLREENLLSSQRIVRLARLVSLAPLAFLLLWTPQLALAVEAWRRISGPALGRWLAAVGEFEALCALAGYAYENPADPFPEIVADSPCFEAEELGHPLLPRSRCVRNNVSLRCDLRVLVISGSNMSGKSTFLRTVGVNAVLALSGAPVRAQRLRLSPFAIGATLRLEDSLQAGRSRFYTEITRLRQLLDLAKSTPPLLFLLDELLQGTNSDERRQGAEAVLRTLLEHGAVGLVTTHDLALTQIADTLSPRAANVHFEDQLENGAMTFDYRMRPGVAHSKNALALMRAVGFEV